VSIGVYIPLRNGGDWCETVTLPAGFNYVALDNQSTDGSADVLRQRGVDVRQTHELLGRLENWTATVRDFLAGPHDWLKWLFVADELFPDAHENLRQAIDAYPQARLIVCDYFVDNAAGRWPWPNLGETRLIQPAEAMALAVERGNWFGAPLAHCVHREALSHGFDFGDLPWVADWRLCLEIAARHPVLYLKQPVGVFDTARHGYHTLNELSLSASLEEGLMRVLAAQHYLRLTGDSTGHQHLLQFAEQSTLQSILKRASQRGITYTFNAA